MTTASVAAPLPHALYLGLQKSGSTFLRHYFFQHPEIHCSRHGLFFQTDAADVSRRGAALVRSDYAERLAGEPTMPCQIDMYEGLAMGYVMHGLEAWDAKVFLTPRPDLAVREAESAPEDLAHRIHAVLPEARILLTIRSQPDWLDSSYRWYLPLLPRARARFQDFLDTLEGRFALDAGHFDRTLELYERVFGAGQVLALPLELLARDEAACLARICAFLGVGLVPYAPGAKNRNEGPAVRWGDLPFQPARDVASRARRLCAAAARLRRSGADVPAEGVLRPSERALLASVYAAGNARLGRRLGLDLGSLGYPV